MLRTRIRKVGTGLGALALVTGVAGASLGAALLSASPAGAAPPSGAYRCTVTDTSSGAHLTSGTLHFPGGGTNPIGTLTVAHVGDTINFHCTGLGTTETVAIVEASGLASLDVPANETKYADLSSAVIGPATGTVLDATLSTTYSNGDTNVTCPVNTMAANLGSLTCIATAADVGTESPLVLVNLSFAANGSPTTTSIGLTKFVVNPATTTSPVAVSTTHGYWWGASEFGTKGANATSPIPNPSVLITGQPITAVGSTGASTLQVSKASYAYHKHTVAQPYPGTPTYPVMSGGVTLPKGMTPGLHSLTVAEGTLESGEITASATFFVPGGSPTTVVGPSGTVGPNTGITITSKGWAPDSTTSWVADWVPPTGCNGTADVPASSFSATPHTPAAPTGDESFSLNTSDLGSLFTTAACVPNQWHVHVTQQVSDPVTVMSLTLPVTLVSLADTCSITSVGTCVVKQAISQTVLGTDLTVTEYAATSGIGAPTQNPSAIQVNLSKVTLGPGVFQAGQGMLNTVEVNDSRGTLSGWTVTGILEHDFQGPTVGNDHTIPADYLTWNPSVSLTYPGNLKTGVVPNGTVSPPVYAPDACPVGAASGGTNSNIKCPTVNDNAGKTNAAGKTNRTTASNHTNVEPWPSATAEGPSGLLNEVKAGPVANLGTATTGEADYGAQPAQLLCMAPAGGGGGAFNCDASLSLAVPPYVAAGKYSATMDILTVAT